MKDITVEQIKEAVAVIGTDDANDEQIESRLESLTGDSLQAQRLLTWLPEAFGQVLVSHTAKVYLPLTFSARSKSGKWHEFKLKEEPIFLFGFRIATEMYHSGPTKVFKNLAHRSSIMSAVNAALQAGKSIETAKISGPATWLPAELYMSRFSIFLRGLFSCQKRG